jgi:hypothetical protein
VNAVQIRPAIGEVTIADEQYVKATAAIKSVNFASVIISEDTSEQGIAVVAAVQLVGSTAACPC